MQRERIPVRLFVIAAAEDAAHQTELEKHLYSLWQQDLLANWQSVQPGGDREEALVQAKLIVLLLSADFHTDASCQEQMQRALERQSRGEVKVFPILLRPVELTNAPFAHLAMVPTNRQAVTQWTNQDEAWTHITEAIRCVLEGKPSNPLTPQQPTPRFLMRGKKLPLFPRWIYVILIILMVGVGAIIAIPHHQDTLLTRYEEEITMLISKQNLRHVQPNDPVKYQAQYAVDDALKQLDDSHKSSFVHFLAGTRLINGEPEVPPIIVFNKANLKNVDFSDLNLYIVYFRETDLRGADFQQATLQGVDMQNANLRDAHITLEQLNALWNVQGTILPDGTTCPRYTDDLSPDGDFLIKVRKDCLSRYHPPS